MDAKEFQKNIFCSYLLECFTTTEQNVTSHYGDLWRGSALETRMFQQQLQLRRNGGTAARRDGRRELQVKK